MGEGCFRDGVKNKRFILRTGCPRKIASVLILLGLLAMLAGCAASGSGYAGKAMRSGDWQEAVRLLTAAGVQQPNNGKVWARLGEAQYRLGQDGPAEQSLKRALALDDRLHSAHLFLGYIAERVNNADLALWHYQVFVDRKAGTPEAKEARKRIEALRQAQATAFAREQVGKERELAATTYPDSTIGVVYFRSERLPDSLRPLAKGLAEMTVTDLSKVPSLQVVERLKTEKLLAELKLAQSSAFDSTTAPRLGKLLGAARVLGGDVSDLEDMRLRMDPQMVSSKTGEVTLPGEQVGELSQFFGMQKQMVFDVLNELGIQLTQAERDSIARIPTESFDAFMAYSRGLDYRDRGDYDAAKSEFERAVEIDPGFTEAGDQFADIGDLSGSEIEQPSSLDAFSAETSDNTEWATSDVNTQGRLYNQLDNTGLVRVSGLDSDDPNTPPAPTETTAIINGRFDE
jgi:tetratricopeptide (TPR) repeat protein